MEKTIRLLVRIFFLPFQPVKLQIAHLVVFLMIFFFAGAIFGIAKSAGLCK
jgi:hypothetical protein